MAIKHPARVKPKPIWAGWRTIIVWSTIGAWLLVTIVLAVKAVTREDQTS